MLEREQPNRHMRRSVHFRVQAVRAGDGGTRRTPTWRDRPSSTLTPRQLTRQIAGSGVAGFRPPQVGAWPPNQPDCGSDGAHQHNPATLGAPGLAEGPVAPLRLLGCGAARRADGMLPAGVAYSRPAAARARQADATRQQQHMQPDRSAGEASAPSNSTVEVSPSTKEQGALTVVNSPHSYRAHLGMSPPNWRETVTPRPRPPVETGEDETVCVVQPSPPRRPGDPPRRPGDAMPVTARHGAYTSGHLGFLAHTPRGELPPMRLDGKASRGRRGIANSLEREFKGAATVLRAGLVPLERQLRQRQWETDAR